jgi:hypothetical protein
VNAVDPLGLEPQNLTDDQREAYIEAIQEFMAYDVAISSTHNDLPSSYDCADVTTYLYQYSMNSATGEENAHRNLQHEGENVTNPDEMQSWDYFTEDTQNVTFYNDTRFNSPNVRVGSIAVWRAAAGASWVGHTATVVAVERDNETGVVIKITIIQGHTGGGATEVVDITRVRRFLINIAWNVSGTHRWGCDGSC